MRIGLIQCGHFPTPENHPATNYTELYTRLLDGFGFTFQTWSVVDMEFPGSVRDVDGWLLSGSKHGAYEDHAFIAPLEDFIRDVYAAEIPMVGICFGHQITAQALGGRVIKRPDGWNCGRRTYDFAGQTKTLLAWHQDEVIVAPPEAETIGSCRECAISMIRYKGNALTIQPHPEFDDVELKIIMDSTHVGAQTPESLEAVRAGMGAPHDNALMARDIAEFFKGN